ncbi:MAG: hypothetical protein HY885_15790 [Deltaproteobacteria bacterium]|nr:hypothetical protein [Deltaproteobacteria bacterium]
MGFSVGLVKSCLEAEIRRVPPVRAEADFSLLEADVRRVSVVRTLSRQLSLLVEAKNRQPPRSPSRRRRFFSSKPMSAKFPESAPKPSVLLQFRRSQQSAVLLLSELEVVSSSFLVEAKIRQLPVVQAEANVLFSMPLYLFAHVHGGAQRPASPAAATEL